MAGSAFLDRRRAGVLLHPTSLPGGAGNGDLGRDAYRFVDFLSDAGMSVWQTLPHGPTHSDRSPYQCLSVHAGNPSWIDLHALSERGWLAPGALDEGAAEPGHWRREQLRAAHAGFERGATAAERAALDDFVARQAHWLDDFALFTAIRHEQSHRPWYEWPAPLRDREPQAMKQARRRLASLLAQIRFEQHLFFEQWLSLKRYANDRGILLFGDMPIYVAHDSADVWTGRRQFDLDDAGRALTVAGVPPDYFSKTGQRWGNPHYRWDVMRNDGFRWWVERMRTGLLLFDLMRIDHFRGFQAYWSIPAAAETAVEGHWVEAPGEELFEVLTREFDPLPVVAEDLGIITPEVEALRRHFGFPGMKILQFAFDGSEDNPYLPDNHEALSVVYTGTHDNDTTLGWWQSLDDQQRMHVEQLLGDAPDMPWALMQLAFESVARLAIVPMQDVLGLGGDQRMNMPGTVQGNWSWRFKWDQLVPERVGWLRDALIAAARCTDAEST